MFVVGRLCVCLSQGTAKRSPHFLRQGLLLAWSSLIRLGPTGHHALGLPVFLSERWGYKRAPLHSALYKGAGAQTQLLMLSCKHLASYAPASAPLLFLNEFSLSFFF